MKQPEIGQKIVSLRKQKGLTQEELVEKCNINVRTIQRIEAGEVTPRSYTLKTIFNVLGFEFEDLHKDSSEATINNEEALFPGIRNKKNKQFYSTHLNIAWICGLIYFLTGFIEFAFDYARFFEDDLILGKAGYLSIKFIVLGTYIYFIRGFYLLGDLSNNYLLKIAALVLISTNVIFYSYDMISLYNELFYPEYVTIIESIFYGIAGLFFGIALLRLLPITGNLATIAGGLKIASSIFFILVFMWWLGLILLIPAVFLQIILLYKIREKVRSIF